MVYESSKDVGASLFFPPVHDRIETAAPDLQGRFYRSPQLYGLKQSRLRSSSTARASGLAPAHTQRQADEFTWNLQIAQTARSEL